MVWRLKEHPYYFACNVIRQISSDLIAHWEFRQIKLEDITMDYLEIRRGYATGELGGEIWVKLDCDNSSGSLG
jgi:hypothetical protein